MKNPSDIIMGCALREQPDPEVLGRYSPSRVRCWLRNLCHWRTKWAVNHLSKQLQRDQSFRQAWHANIAMPIYDATREPNGAWIEKVDQQGHPYHVCACREMPIEQANQIADKLMKHLFSA